MNRNLLLKNILYILSVILFMMSCEQSNKRINSDSISVIPQPQNIEASEGVFTINKNTTIQYQGNLKSTAQYLNSHLKNKISILEYKNGQDNQILLSIVENEALGKEGYDLTVTEKGIQIEGNSAGVFYGVQTLLQLVIETNDKALVPLVHITDKPRFSWRGMHLDVSRHFFDKELVKKYIDILAKHKLNTFHWHLTDDQGWRIDIDAFPKLKEMAAWRLGSDKDEWNYDVHAAEEGKPKYGGFYTKEDIREVLAYAEERFITVIPEIELPAHSWAALLAYPNLSCTGKVWHKGKSWSFSDPFCAGNEETFTFFETVLTEVIDLFPSPYIHIGGDEAKKTTWKTCSKCQNRIKKEGLKDENELQSYFIKRIAKFIQSKGRKMVGWDEILEGGLAPDAIVMSWRGEKGGIEAAKEKHEVIMTPGEFLYFNNAQYSPELEGIPYAEVLDLALVYNYNPTPKELNEEEQKLIKGVEACIWTEFVYSEDQVFERLLPRIAALAEIAWLDNEKKDWNHFQGKLVKYFAFLDMHDIDYFISPPNSPNISSFVDDSISVVLELPFSGAQIYYTLDGTEPSKKSILYADPIVVSHNTTIKAVTMLPSGKSSAVFEQSFVKITHQEATVLQHTKEGVSLNYYKGSISQLSEFNAMKVLKKPETVANIEMPEGMPDDFFGLKYNGYIKVPKDGIYTFYTSSDDGSQLFVDDTMVVNNDGFHGMQEKNGEIALRSGYHKLAIDFFEGSGGEGLDVKMEGPDIEKGNILSSFLFTKTEQ